MTWQDNLKNMINKKPDTLHSLFINLLKQHSAYNRFINNLEAAKHFPDFKRLIVAECPREWICEAFTWCESPEGHDYWVKIDIQWREVWSQNEDLEQY